VKVFIDEDTGAGLGRALREVDVDSAFVGKRGLVTFGTKDVCGFRA
jgi:hypothetical protein